MQLSLSAADLAAYITRQLNVLFPDHTVSPAEFQSPFARALERTEYCFSHINLKYFSDGGQSRFNHLHTDQYAMFLYFLANTVYRLGGDPALASKIYALNKTLHSVDAYYEVELPEIFAFQHPVGTVLGRGTYSNYFFVYQRCGIGASIEGQYPTIGEGVVMFGDSAIIGDCTIGANCWLSVGTVVMDTDVPSNSVVFGRSPHLVRKPTKRNVMRDLFLRGSSDLHT